MRRPGGRSRQLRPILLCGYTMEGIVKDYGLDLAMYTYNAQGELEDGVVYFQVKATDALKLRSRGQTVAFRLDRADLESWATWADPVILVVYDAQADVAYWLYVQDYMERMPARPRRRLGATVTVYLPRTNVLNCEAVRRFARFRDAVQSQTRGVSHHA